MVREKDSYGFDQALSENSRMKENDNTMDIQELPSRKEYHNKGDSLITGPIWIRLLLLLFILLIFIVLSYTYWEELFEDSNEDSVNKQEQPFHQKVDIKRDISEDSN